MIKKHFYDIADDLKEYPEAVFIFVIGGRNTGKTYSALKEEYSNGRIFGFVKRTNRDLATLCAGRKIGQKMDDAQIDFGESGLTGEDLKFLADNHQLIYKLLTKTLTSDDLNTSGKTLDDLVPIVQQFAKLINKTFKSNANEKDIDPAVCESASPVADILADTRENDT